ncbi:MAG: hypothetical protein QM817_40750 [Archangium sp.]
MKANRGKRKLAKPAKRAKDQDAAQLERKLQSVVRRVSATIKRQVRRAKPTSKAEEALILSASLAAEAARLRVPRPEPIPDVLVASLDLRGYAPPETYSTWSASRFWRATTIATLPPETSFDAMLTWLQNELRKEPSSRVRVLGKRHSYSDVLAADYSDRTPTLVLQIAEHSPPRVLLPVIGNEEVRLKADRSAVVRVDARATVRQVALALRAKDLELPNQGGFADQSIAGALSCSTHGSGFRHEPLSSMVVAFDFMGPDGRVRRIQAKDLPLTEGDFRSNYSPEFSGTHHPSDELLHAARVSLGEFGVCVSLLLDVPRAYKLLENRRAMLWGEAKRELIKAGGLAALASKFEHLEIWINPNRPERGGAAGADLEASLAGDERHPIDGRHCIVVDRTRCATGRENTPFKDPAEGQVEFQDGAAASAYDPVLAGCVAPRLDTELDKLELTDRVGFPTDVFDIGKANQFWAVSGEYFFPEPDAVRMVEKYIRRIQDNFRDLGHAHPGWLSLRILAKTDSHLGLSTPNLEYSGAWCSIELPLICGKARKVRDGCLERIQRSLATYQALCQSEGGRFHWAQHWDRPADISKYVRNQFPLQGKWREAQLDFGGERFRHSVLP